MNSTSFLFRICIFIALLTNANSSIGAACFQKTPARTVKIGLLIPDNKSLAAKQGAELAISLANEKGGFNGRSFQLVTLSMEGAWGKGSKQAVNLIFDQEVVAIMGSHDGRNAHLVEQVCAKTRMIFLSAWASDPTLAQAFVPWYFSCMPNDLQQAAALIEEIYNKRKIQRVAVICDDDYDSKSGLDNFLKKVKQARKPLPLQFIYENKSPDPDSLLTRISRSAVQAIVLFGEPLVSMSIVREIRKSKINIPVFGSLLLLNENYLKGDDLQILENEMFFPSGNWSGSKIAEFRQEFQKTYQKAPGAVAAFAFDGMNVLIDAIRKAGPDHDNLQKSLATMHYEGVTGTIRFDDKGNRSGTFATVSIAGGIPVSLK